MGMSVNWDDIETSDGVFSWTTLDDRISHFAADGQDIYYQIYSTPASARVPGQSWATVPDQDGVAGAGCVPDTTKLARFVTALLTRYPQITHISPWNEPKAGGNAVVRFTGATTGSVTTGQTVTGQTSGATGTVLSNSGTSLVVRLGGAANVVTPFANAEQVRVDGSNYFTASQQAAVWYWYGTKAELVTHCQTVYTAAKAVNPSVIVMTPDFVEGANVSGEEEWIATWIDAGGRGYFDAVAYHFYNYDIRQATKTADAYSIIARCDDIDAILSVRGLSSVGKYATEIGGTTGWSFINYSADKGAQAKTIKRVTAYLAARGWKSAIWYNHDGIYAGNPAGYPEIAQAMKWLGVILSGKTISGAYVGEDNTLRMLVDGSQVVV